MTDAAPALLLRADALRVGYGGRPLIEPLAFEVRAGEAWAVVGENGTGKTTLLRTLLGLHAPVSGRVERPRGLRVGYVPQVGTDDLSVPRRVIDFVQEGAVRGWSFVDPRAPARARAAVAAAMERTRTVELARRPFQALSVGQRQRVRIARALASQPALLVLDEPTSALDTAHVAAVHAVLDDLREASGLGVLVVTHRDVFLEAAATHVIRLRPCGTATTRPVVRP